MNNTLAVSKDQNYYKLLVETFMKDAKLEKIAVLEKQKFLAMCVVNKLNPFKGEIYAIPRGDKLTITIAYTVYLERAEASGKLSGRNIMIKKDGDKVTGGKIQIYRKDWNHPFEYEGDIKDFIVSTNSLRQTKAEAMMRKQLIRIGFSHCFPENCATLNVDEIEPEQVIDAQEEAPKVLEADPEIPTTPDVCISPDQISIIKSLAIYLPEEILSPDTYTEAEDLIVKMKIEIGRLFLKEKSLKLSEDECKMIFTGSNQDVKNILKAAKATFTSKKD